MQSQQRKVKWSRGETADAIAERTDTGITAVSVSKLENIISDIYGNLSRRPAFKLLNKVNTLPASTACAQFYDNNTVHPIPYYITDSDYIIFLFADHYTYGDVGSHLLHAIRIRDNVIIASNTQSGSSGLEISGPYSYAQQNNYLIIASANGVNLKITTTATSENTDFNVQIEDFEYTGGWYAPNGTTTKKVTSSGISGLNFSGGFHPYIVEDINGIATEYSTINTGVDSAASLQTQIPIGSIVTFPNIGCTMRIEGYIPAAGAIKVRAYGALLTPAADEEKSDVQVKVESGFVPLSSKYEDPITRDNYKCSFTACTFDQQRLWISGLKGASGSYGAYQAKNYYGLALASQIARYNDFKNDYNYENEPITVDISTKYQEQVLYIESYNGIKILTDAAEWSYDPTNGVIKQSQNGSLVGCRPITFGSVLLYADKTGQYIRAMQYELQSNLFNSSKVNKFTQEDLIWQPVAMAQYEDKMNYTGKFLFVLNRPDGRTASYPVSRPQLAVCNFVPDVQAMIWSRWNNPRQNPVRYSNIVIDRYAWKAGDSIVYTQNAEPIPGEPILDANGHVLTTYYHNFVKNYDNNSISVDTAFSQSQTGVNLYAWGDDAIVYTRTQTPTTGTQLFNANNQPISTYYQNTVYNVSGNTIEVIVSQSTTSNTQYAWTSSSRTVYTYYEAYAEGATVTTTGGETGTMTGSSSTLTGFKFGGKTYTRDTSKDTWVSETRHYAGYSSGNSTLWITFSAVTNPAASIQAYSSVGARNVVAGTITSSNMTIVTTGGYLVIGSEQFVRNGSIDIPSGTVTRQRKSFARNSARDLGQSTVDVITTTEFARATEEDVKHAEGVEPTGSQSDIIRNAISIGNKVYFILADSNERYAIAELDYEATLDYDTIIVNNKFEPFGVSGSTFTGATVRVYDGDTYMFDAQVGADGTLTRDVSTFSEPHAGFWVEATLESHPMDINSSTFDTVKRIAKGMLVVRNTEPHAVTINDRTGYMSPDKKTIEFYNCSGMKKEVRYKITNKQGAKFTIESATLNMEYGTLIS